MLHIRNGHWRFMNIVKSIELYKGEIVLKINTIKQNINDIECVILVVEQKLSGYTDNTASEHSNSVMNGNSEKIQSKSSTNQ